MINRSSTSFIAGLILAGSLAAGPLAVSRAVAQEAIMLESIGAVRMARPEEVKRSNDDAIAQQRLNAPSAPVAERHAAIVE